MKTLFKPVQISFVLIFLSLVAGCQKHSKRAQQNDAIQAILLPNAETICNDLKLNKKHLMVVFIHGTVLPQPNIKAFFSSLRKRFKHDNNRNKSWSQIYVNELKNKSIHRYQPSGPEGLHPVGSQISAQIAAAMYQKLFEDPCLCYTFGWCGKLSQRKRLIAANNLYAQLLEERKHLQEKYGEIEVIVIGHSHGGNVALNLAQVEQKQNQHLIIDKLVLLGTPIQSETAGYAKALCFKKVYNFYSRGDRIQTLDNISTKDEHSARKFTLHSNKLVQVELKIGDKKPGHNELWLFCGKDNWLYRKHSLALSPFPVFVFLPIILRQLDEKLKFSHNILLKIDKQNQRLCFDFYDSKHDFKTDIDEKSLDKYRNAILAY